MACGVPGNSGREPGAEFVLDLFEDRQSPTSSGAEPRRGGTFDDEVRPVPRRTRSASLRMRRMRSSYSSQPSRVAFSFRHKHWMVVRRRPSSSPLVRAIHMFDARHVSRNGPLCSYT